MTAIPKKLALKRVEDAINQRVAWLSKRIEGFNPESYPTAAILEAAEATDWKGLDEEGARAVREAMFQKVEAESGLFPEA